ncbi:ATP-binding cassette domain-containing protein [Brevibacterium sp. 50QC2O2]|jgi:ABC-type glutathione transport system ATPase component|uniref:ATP-binding cassette domain-containing protein n=1 Tax=Brevibacterium sp. 50QC2O2 TaxID=2968459 RepID=UPI00211CB9F1|nr:ATP-binding cassette domain-containing protein [Brevibacterium sp. 50QC2O2]MCQ9388468.1 ATP-binding cassette domain-containing protein [Brevibacterium sp. 50QC2O2]
MTESTAQSTYSASARTTPLLQVKDLDKVYSSHNPFSSKRRENHAVKGISFDIPAGTTYALVGESGSGKSTTGRMIQGLEERTAGTVVYDGREIDLGKSRSITERRQIQTVFQDPYSSLNPRRRIGTILAEALKIVGERSPEVIRKRVLESLEQVGFGAEHAGRFPHEFSGGQRQRIGIARALMVDPRLLILDEPVSALDVSIQAQVLNLLRRLQRDTGLTYFFISHDMSVVRYMAHRIGVMYKGELVEEGTPDRIFGDPQHEYTKKLLKSVPITHPGMRRARTGKQEG